MPKRASSFVRKMEILQFTLLASEEIKRGRNVFFAINSNLFDKEWMWSTDYTVKGGKQDIRKRIEKSPGRKIFRTQIQELLEEKLLVRIHTSDDRAKWYSITPLGICQLIKSEEFFDGIKLPMPERYFVILVLMSFAIPNVKQYESLIFEKQKFFNSDTDFWEDLIKTGMSIREELPHVLSNIDIEINKFSFNVTNGFYEENNIPLAKGKFIEENLIQVIELNKKSGVIRGDPNYNPLSLDEEQFHHYFANLLMCALIYDYTVATFDNIQNKHLKQTRRGKSPIKETSKEFSKKWVKYPEYFQRIAALFSKHATKIVSEQTTLMSDFSLVLR